MDLTTRYMGLKLREPARRVGLAAQRRLGNIRRLEDAGAGAVVLPSIFEEEIIAERREIELRQRLPASRLRRGADPISRPRAAIAVGPERYLDLVRRAKEAVAIPVIASLNGDDARRAGSTTPRLVEQAGADAIELNVYFIPADPDDDRQRGRAALSRHADGGEGGRDVPGRGQAQSLFQRLRRHGAALAAAGADGLVALQPLLPAGHRRRRRSACAGPRAQHAGRDPAAAPLDRVLSRAGAARSPPAPASKPPNEVIKYLLAGADVVMTTSALLRHGVEHMTTRLVDNLERWLEARNIESLNRIRGKMRRGRRARSNRFRSSQLH